MWSEEIRCKLLLWCLEEIGTVRLSRLCEVLGSARQALRAGARICAETVNRPSLALKWHENWPDPSAYSALADGLDELGVAVIHKDSETYPETLRSVGGPEFLFVKGDRRALDSGLLAVVGTRAVREDGIRLTRTVVRWAAARGWHIASGGAMGVDAAAHDESVHLGIRTVVVLPAGLSFLVPTRHKRMYASICARGGCLVSEHPPWRSPSPRLFVRRNRLISGLSAATVVVRAPRSSGALITAKWARKQGRPVFVTPGGPCDPTAAGCLDELARGAHLLRSADDLPARPGGRDLPKSAALRADPADPEAGFEGSELAVRSLDMLACGPATVDGIIFQVDATPQDVVIEVTNLILAERVARIGSGQIKRLL